MKLFAPSYYSSFRCIGKECTKNCCIGWEIDVDDDTLNKYRKLDGELGERIRQSIYKDGGGAHLKLCDGERCAHLRADNLCSLIIELGEEMIPEICREHPRFYNVYDGVCEVGVGLACPTAAKLITSANDYCPYEIGKIDIREAEEIGAGLNACRAYFGAVCDFGKKVSLFDTVVFADYHARITLSDLLFDCLTRPDADEKITADAFFPCAADSTEYAYENGEARSAAALFSELEMLDSGYGEALCEAIEYGEREGEKVREFFAEFKGEFLALFHYFIYRHLLNGALDGGAHAVIKFAAISAYAILSLAQKSGKGIADEATDFSRNVEYSDTNVSSILEKAVAEEVGIGFILRILKLSDNC